MLKKLNIIKPTETTPSLLEMQGAEKHVERYHGYINPVVGNITEQIMWFLLQVNYIIKEGNLEEI